MLEPGRAEYKMFKGKYIDLRDVTHELEFNNLVKTS